VLSPQLYNLPGPEEAWKVGRDIMVHLPSSFDENLAKEYRDVLVLNDGQKFSDETWPLTVDGLVLSGAIDELVVVCVPSPPSGEQRMAELTPTPGDGRRMPAYLAAHESAVAQGESVAAAADEDAAEAEEAEGHGPYGEPGFFGHLDDYLRYISDSVLPAVRARFPRVVMGGRLGIAGKCRSRSDSWDSMVHNQTDSLRRRRLVGLRVQVAPWAVWAP
jgi:hypothetical protein